MRSTRADFGLISRAIEPLLLGAPFPVSGERIGHQLSFVVDGHPICLEHKAIELLDALVELRKQGFRRRIERPVVVNLAVQQLKGLLGIPSASGNDVNKALVRKFVKRSIMQSPAQILEIGKVGLQWTSDLFPFLQVVVVYCGRQRGKSDGAHQNGYSLKQVTSVLLKSKTPSKVDSNYGKKRLRPCGPNFWLRPSPIQVEAKLMHISPVSWGEA